MEAKSDNPPTLPGEIWRGVVVDPRAYLSWIIRQKRPEDFVSFRRRPLDEAARINRANQGAMPGVLFTRQRRGGGHG